jgi:hypothetical protein
MYSTTLYNCLFVHALGMLFASGCWAGLDLQPWPDAPRQHGTKFAPVWATTFLGSPRECAAYVVVAIPEVGQ